MNIKKWHVNPVDFPVYCLIALYYILTIAFLGFKGADPWVVLTFLVIGVYAFCQIVRPQENISVHRIFFLFVFFFFFFAPLRQYLTDYTAWSRLGPYTDRDYLVANLLLILFLAAFEAVYFLFRPKPHRELSLLKADPPTDISVSVTVLLAVLIGLGLLAVSLISKETIANLEESSNIGAQLLKILRFFPVAALMMIFLQKGIQKNTRLITLGILAVECLIIFFPFSATLSRNMLFGVYLIILTLLFSRSKYKSWLFLLFIVGFEFVFSSFNYFKLNSDISGFRIIRSDYRHVDFDAYQLLMSSIRYVSDFGILWGKNILTAALNFVPRGIWNGKLVPSGQLVSEAYGCTFTNLSDPLPAEWFLAFGWAGVPIGGALTALLVKWIDRCNRDDRPFGKMIFCIVSGFTIFISRGALLPTVSYTFALLLSTVFLLLLWNLASSVNHKIRSGTKHV